MTNSFNQNSEALTHEAPRRVFDEAGNSLQNDLRHYEGRRLDKIRDLHIAYARSAATHMQSGMPAETAMRIMIEEIPLAGFDRTELIPLVNYFLSENHQSIAFDTNLNVHQDGIFISSGDAEAKLRDYDDAREEASHAEYLHFAQAIATRIVSGIPFDMMMTICKSDLVWYNMDNGIVAAYVNDCLDVLGSPVRVDRYFEKVTFESFD